MAQNDFAGYKFCLMTSIDWISCALGCEPSTFCQLVLGGITFFNFLNEGREVIMKCKQIMLAVGAIAAGRNISSHEGNEV